MNRQINLYGRKVLVSPRGSATADPNQEPVANVPAWAVAAVDKRLPGVVASPTPSTADAPDSAAAGADDNSLSKAPELQVDHHMDALEGDPAEVTVLTIDDYAQIAELKASRQRPLDDTQVSTDQQQQQLQRSSSADPTHKSGRRRKWKSPMAQKRTISKTATVRVGDVRPKFKYTLADDDDPDETDWDSPGPGEYNVPQNPLPRGGKLSTATPKNDVEWQIYIKSQIPGPADYPAPKLPQPSGGRFGNSCPKSALEWTIYRAQQIPGPADYCSHGEPSDRGGKFSTAKPKSDVEWQIYRAKRLPGPDYNPKYDALSTMKRAPCAPFATKAVKGNYQTTLADPVTFVMRTVNDHGPNQCRETGAVGKQADSTKITAPAFSFGPPSPVQLKRSKSAGSPAAGTDGTGTARSKPPPIKHTVYNDRSLIFKDTRRDVPGPGRYDPSLPAALEPPRAAPFGTAPRRAAKNLRFVPDIPVKQHR